MNIAILAGILFASPAAKPSCCVGAPATANLCPICGLDVPKDTPEIDNRVVLERAGKKTEYRCVLCAVADAKADQHNLIILAPSEKKGKPVKMIREAGKWAVEPLTAQFAYVKGSHSQCEVRYRALTNKEAFEAYVQTKPKVLASAKLIGLDEMIERSE